MRVSSSALLPNNLSCYQSHQHSNCGDYWAKTCPCCTFLFSLSGWGIFLLFFFCLPLFVTKFLLLFAADLHKRETRKAGGGGGGERVQGGRGTSTNLPVGYNSCLWCCLAIRQISRIRWQSIQFVANSIFDLLQSKMWPQAACSRQQAAAVAQLAALYELWAPLALARKCRAT